MHTMYLVGRIAVIPPLINSDESRFFRRVLRVMLLVVDLGYTG